MLFRNGPLSVKFPGSQTILSLFLKDRTSDPSIAAGFFEREFGVALSAARGKMARMRSGYIFDVLNFL